MKEQDRKAHYLSRRSHSRAALAESRAAARLPNRGVKKNVSSALKRKPWESYLQRSVKFGGSKNAGRVKRKSVIESVGPGTHVSVDKTEGFGREERDGWLGAIRQYED